MIGTDRAGRFQTIPVGRLRPAAGLIRALPAPEELESLVASVQRHGVLHPLLVRPSGSDFEIICGVRRWMAARLARLGTVPAIVRDLDEREALEISLAENRDRKPLSAEDRGRALVRLQFLFPTHTRRELESWIGAPAPAVEPAEEREEPTLPAWMDESANAATAETVVRSEEKYWLEEMAERAGAEPEPTRVPIRLLPQARQLLEGYTKTGILDPETLTSLLDGLLDSLSNDPPHVFLDLAYREPPKRYLPRHCLNVAKLALFLGRGKGLSAEFRDLATCALLHDVGMFQVDEAAFKRRTALSDEEWAHVRSHPQGGQILQTKEVLLRDVFSHAVPHLADPDVRRVCARIVNVADTYEAMVSPRVNRLPLLPHEGMRAVMDEGARGMLDWDLVELFTRTFGIYPVGSYLRVRTGEVAVVLRSNEETPALPVIRIFADAGRMMLRKTVTVDLSQNDPPLSFEPIPRPM